MQNSLLLFCLQQPFRSFTNVIISCPVNSPYLLSVDSAGCISRLVTILIAVLYILSNWSFFFFWNTRSKTRHGIPNKSVWGEHKDNTTCLALNTFLVQSVLCVFWLFVVIQNYGLEHGHLVICCTFSMLFCRTPAESIIPHFVFWSWLPQLCTVFAFTPVQLYSVCIDASYEFCNRVLK